MRFSERHLSARSVPRREADGAVLWHGLVADVTREVNERLGRARLLIERDQARLEATTCRETIARMSHEVRTPLNAILGFAQLLRGLPEPGQEQALLRTQWVHQIHKAGSHLLELVNEALELESIKARMPMVKVKPVDLDSVVHSVLDLLRPEADQKQLHLDLPGPTKQLVAMADRRGLCQVLINLVGNAIKFTPAGGTVVVRLASRRQQVRIHVSDNGPGISRSSQAGLFQPFARGDAPRQGQLGTGLGLAISRQLVRAMGGGLSLDSAPGAGSTFSVHLRAASEALPATSSHRLFVDADAVPSAVEPAWPSGLVLYVEDEPVNRMLMSEFFAQLAPLRLELASTLKDGLALANHIRPDLVLMDMHLPDGTGYQGLQSLRVDPRTSDIEVIALSADAGSSQIELALRAGLDDYWVKPIRLAEMGAALRRVLGAAASRADRVRAGSA